MPLPDEDRQAFKDAATKFVAWRESAELKAKQTGQMAMGGKDAIATVQKLTNLLFKFNQQHHVGGVRFRGSLFVLNKGTGPLTVIPERGIEAIDD